MAPSSFIASALVVILLVYGQGKYGFRVEHAYPV